MAEQSLRDTTVHRALQREQSDACHYWKHPMAQIFIPCSVLKLLWFLLLIVLLLFPVSAKQGNVHRLL